MLNMEWTFFCWNKSLFVVLSSQSHHIKSKVTAVHGMKHAVTAAWSTTDRVDSTFEYENMQMSVDNFIAIHPIIIQIFQAGTKQWIN